MVPRARSWCTRRITTFARWSRRSWRRRPLNASRPSRRQTRRGILGQVSERDLFVVCKNCSSEVSPYVTECPYCGQRVRKRAPKIERGTTTDEPRPRGRRRRSRGRSSRPKQPTLSRLRRDEIPGIAPETRPYVTGALIVVALLASIVTATARVDNFDLGGIYL